MLVSAALDREKTSDTKVVFVIAETVKSSITQLIAHLVTFVTLRILEKEQVATFFIYFDEITLHQISLFMMKSDFLEIYPKIVAICLL